MEDRKFFVSEIVRNKRIPELLLEEVNEKIFFIYLMTAFTWWNRVDVF